MKIKFIDKDKIRRRYLWLWLGVKKNWFPAGDSHHHAQVQLRIMEWMIKGEENKEKAPRIEIKGKTFEEDKFKERLSKEPRKVIEEERKHDIDAIKMVKDLNRELEKQGEKLKEARELIEGGEKILEVKEEDAES